MPLCNDKCLSVHASQDLRTPSDGKRSMYSWMYDDVSEHQYARGSFVWYGGTLSGVNDSPQV